MPRLTAIRRQALDEVMKEAIFEATISALSEHGVEGLTMDRVALAAGVAKGSLYNYFRSKKSLLEFVYMKTIDPAFQDLEAVVASDRTAREKLATHLRWILEHVAKHAQVFRVLFRDDTAQGLLQSSERSAREMCGQYLAKIFDQGICEGVFRPADPLLLGRMFLGLCMGVFDSHPELERTDVREEIYRLIMDMFLDGIVTEKGRAGRRTA
ncbi:MAG: TetR/AcrR family transcriptional regulator [Rhodopirellula sp.]|nr:TetR/AcrR family transcriptional regulator [Rhodopirellula sp.]